MVVDVVDIVHSMAWDNCPCSNNNPYDVNKRYMTEMEMIQIEYHLYVLYLHTMSSIQYIRCCG